MPATVPLSIGCFPTITPSESRTVASHNLPQLIETKEIDEGGCIRSIPEESVRKKFATSWKKSGTSGADGPIGIVLANETNPKGFNSLPHLDEFSTPLQLGRGLASKR